MLLSIEWNRESILWFPHSFKNESFKSLIRDKTKKISSISQLWKCNNNEIGKWSYECVRWISVLSEERCNVFEGVLKLTRINGVPYRTNLPFGNTAGVAELWCHWREAWCWFSFVGKTRIVSGERDRERGAEDGENLEVRSKVKVWNTTGLWDWDWSVQYWPRFERI